MIALCTYDEREMSYKVCIAYTHMHTHTHVYSGHYVV